jgi:hypothetical protein
VPAADGAPVEQEAKPPLRPLADLPGRLVLSKAGSESAREAMARPAAARRTRSRAAAPARPGATDEPAESAERVARAASSSPARGSGNGATTAADQPRGKITRRTRKTKDGLPEGWVIDDEGYVVPRHG